MGPCCERQRESRIPINEGGDSGDSQGWRQCHHQHMSVAGLVGGALDLSAYHASKHGVIGLTKAAALELASRKIRVKAICPGVVPTDMTEQWFEGSGLKDALQASHPVGRFGTSEETAQAVLCRRSVRVHDRPHAADRRRIQRWLISAILVQTGSAGSPIRVGRMLR